MVKQTEQADFVILGLENQQRIHYAMPLRSRLYDDLSFLKQCESFKQVHKKEKDYLNADEFLSGVRKENRFRPVFSIVVYYQDKPWDGPEKLSDMMDIPDKWKPFFEDYSMVLVKVVEGKPLPFKNMTNTQFFELVQDSCKLDKETLLKKYREKETITKEALLAAGAVTGTKQFVNLAVETKGEIVMCENMEKLFKAEQEEGKKDGRLEKLIEQIQKKLAKGKPIPVIADELEESVETIERMIKENELQ